VEQVSGIERDYGVMEIPTILFFRDGEIIDHLAGLAPKNVMIAKIENALSTNIN
jgi:thioredoxin 1